MTARPLAVVIPNAAMTTRISPILPPNEIVTLATTAHRQASTPREDALTIVWAGLIIRGPAQSPATGAKQAVAAYLLAASRHHWRDARRLLPLRKRFARNSCILTR